MTRLPRARSLLLLAAAPLLIFSLSGFSGYFTTQVFNQPSGDSFFAHGSCSTHSYVGGGTCTGLGQGFLGGGLFTGLFRTNDALTALSCSHQSCRGGSLRASGTGTWGAQKVAFTFCGDDPYPSRMARVEIDFHSVSTLDLTGISPFPQIACGKAQSASIVSRVGSDFVSGVFVFNCRDCFRLVRANR